MKNNWLRGVLLGVSLALLLGGGIAVAQQRLTARQDQDCLPCWPYYFGEGGEWPTAEYVLRITLEGLSPSALLCERWVPPMGAPDIGCSPESFGTETLQVFVAAGCDADMCVWHGDHDEGPDFCFDPLVFGDWRIDFWQQGGGEPMVPGVIPASVDFELAEVCEEEEEFVPEPGSMLLLGSGLMGLAGYATLRWRARQ